MNLNEIKLAIIGLGYVGLPLAVEFGKHRSIIGFDINETRSIVPAVTHVDYSARIQTVNKESNRKLYNLINEFYKITNIPMLVNTSFNLRGEPIVESPMDALRCFMSNELDILVLENFVLYKPDQSEHLYINKETTFELD